MKLWMLHTHFPYRYSLCMQVVEVVIPVSKWNDFEQKSFQELTGKNTQENSSEFIKTMILKSTKSLHGHSLPLNQAFN